MRCRNCGLTFAELKPTDDELAENYGRYSREDYDSPITRIRYRELLDSFEPYRQTNRILDIGCGIGFFLEEAEGRGWDAYGSELEPRAVEINRKKGLNCIQASIGLETFKPNSFDVVTAFEVVEHLRDPNAEANMIARALRPGGQFYCTTPNFSSVSRHLLGDRWRLISYPEHLSYFTPSTLCSWLKHFGFKPRSVITTGFSIARVRGHRASFSEWMQGTERMRVQTERSPSLRLAKSAANTVLGATRTGDTIKACFELVER